MFASGWSPSSAVSVPCANVHSPLRRNAGRRSAAFNKHKSLREFSVGQQVLLKTPVLIGSLESSWERPFLVKHKLSRVNYRVTTLDGKKPRVVHINNCKVYAPRSVEVSSITVSLWKGLESSLVTLSRRLLQQLRRWSPGRGRWRLPLAAYV